MKMTAEQDKAWIALIAAQCKFLRTCGWDSNGSGLWAPPWDAGAHIWDLDHAVMEQNVRFIRGEKAG